MTGERKTFTVPDGHESVRDADGRATGEVRPAHSSSGNAIPRYSVAMYTDGPAMRWNVIDRQTQKWVRRFATKKEAEAHAMVCEAHHNFKSCNDSLHSTRRVWR